MPKLIIDGNSFDVPKEVLDKYSKMKIKLKQVQAWVDKTDSLVNGCSIEEEYNELEKIMSDESNL